MKKIKSFSLFESHQSPTEEALSVVKEILMELDFLDISYNAVIRRCGSLDYDSNRELIRISIFKPISHSSLPKSWMKYEDIPKSFSYRDISSVVENIVDYLLSESWVISDEKELYNSGIWNVDSYIHLRTQYRITFLKKRRVG